ALRQHPRVRYCSRIPSSKSATRLTHASFSRPANCLRNSLHRRPREGVSSHVSDADSEVHSMARSPCRAGSLRHVFTVVQTGLDSRPTLLPWSLFQVFMAGL